MSKYMDFIEKLRKSPHDWLKKDLEELFRVEHQSMQVVHYMCGLCDTEYEIELHVGDLRMVKCTECGNTTHQLARGME